MLFAIDLNPKFVSLDLETKCLMIKVCQLAPVNNFGDKSDGTFCTWKFIQVGSFWLQIRNESKKCLIIKSFYILGVSTQKTMYGNHAILLKIWSNFGYWKSQKGTSGPSTFSF